MWSSIGLGKKEMSKDSNINTDTLRVDVAYLILFSFPHS